MVDGGDGLAEIQEGLGEDVARGGGGDGWVGGAGGGGRAVKGVVGGDLHHNLEEVLDHIFDLFWRWRL